jgi:hypothetical protein
LLFCAAPAVWPRGPDDGDDGRNGCCLVVAAAVRNAALGALGRAAEAAATAPAFPATLTRFVDVAKAAGLDYTFHLNKRPLTILSTIGNGCAFLDLDNDGNLDILLVGQPLALFRGDGRGRFTDDNPMAGLDRLQGIFWAAPWATTTTTARTFT